MDIANMAIVHRMHASTAYVWLPFFSNIALAWAKETFSPRGNFNKFQYQEIRAQKKIVWN